MSYLSLQNYIEVHDVIDPEKRIFHMALELNEDEFWVIGQGIGECEHCGKNEWEMAAIPAIRDDEGGDYISDTFANSGADLEVRVYRCVPCKHWILVCG